MPAGEEGVVLGGGGAGRHLGEDRVDGPEQVTAASTRWLCRSSRMPPPSAAEAFSRQRSLGAGRHRSQRNSWRNDLTQPTGSHDLASGRVLGVEAAVLEDREGHTGRPGCVDDLQRLRRVRGQRLVDHDGDARLHALPGVIGMQAAGSGEHDEVEAVHRQQRLQIRDHLGRGHVLADLSRARRICGRDRGDRHTGLLQEWGVEVPACRAEPRQAHGSHGDTIALSSAVGFFLPSRLGHQTRSPMS